MPLLCNVSVLKEIAAAKQRIQEMTCKPKYIVI